MLCFFGFHTYKYIKDEYKDIGLEEKVLWTSYLECKCGKKKTIKRIAFL